MKLYHEVRGCSLAVDIVARELALPLALEWVEALSDDMAKIEQPIEVRSLGRTLKRWKHQIAAWHESQVSNGPTEAVNNLIKRVKRAAFGFTKFRHYRIRALLYAGKPDWSQLQTVSPP